jgi:hypothetical protein
MLRKRHMDYCTVCKSQQSCGCAERFWLYCRYYTFVRLLFRWVSLKRQRKIAISLVEVTNNSQTIERIWEEVIPEDINK